MSGPRRKSLRQRTMRGSSHAGARRLRCFGSREEERPSFRSGDLFLKSVRERGSRPGPSPTTPSQSGPSRSERETLRTQRPRREPGISSQELEPVQRYGAEASFSSVRHGNRDASGQRCDVRNDDRCIRKLLLERLSAGLDQRPSTIAIAESTISARLGSERRRPWTSSASLNQTLNPGGTNAVPGSNSLERRSARRWPGGRSHDERPVPLFCMRRAGGRPVGGKLVCVPRSTPCRGPSRDESAWADRRETMRDCECRAVRHGLSQAPGPGVRSRVRRSSPREMRIGGFFRIARAGRCVALVPRKKGKPFSPRSGRTARWEHDEVMAFASFAAQRPLVRGVRRPYGYCTQSTR